MFRSSNRSFPGNQLFLLLLPSYFKFLDPLYWPQKTHRPPNWWQQFSPIKWNLDVFVSVFKCKMDMLYNRLFFHTHIYFCHWIGRVSVGCVGGDKFHQCCCSFYWSPAEVAKVNNFPFKNIFTAKAISERSWKKTSHLWAEFTCTSDSETEFMGYKSPEVSLSLIFSLSLTCFCMKQVMK